METIFRIVNNSIGLENNIKEKSSVSNYYGRSVSKVNSSVNIIDAKSITKPKPTLLANNNKKTTILKVNRNTNFFVCEDGA